MLTLTPIGTVRTGKGTKFAAGHQPDPSALETHVIELVPGMELAVQDLATFDHIWLIWWFDQNKSWRQRVLPPRGPAVRRGVLATRSPHRPNPIGLTCVRLLSVDGLNLTVGPLDLLDGTPIFDIRPYLTTVDCFPEASLGWLAEVDALSPQYSIVLSELALEQLNWLREEWGVDFWTRASQVLALDPRPHRTRRILAMDDGFRMACGPWRVYAFRQRWASNASDQINP